MALANRIRLRNAATIVLGVVSMPRLLAIGLLALLASCADNVMLSYTPETEIDQGPPNSVSDVIVTDARGDDPFKLATMLSPIGAPTNGVVTPMPAAELVAGAMRGGLIRRGMFSPDAGHRIIIKLTKLEGTYYLGPRTAVAMTLQVVDPTGVVTYQTSAGDASSNFAPGTDISAALLPTARFLAVVAVTDVRHLYNFRTLQLVQNEEMRQALQSTMSRVVDRLLDNVRMWKAVSEPTF